MCLIRFGKGIKWTLAISLKKISISWDPIFPTTPSISLKELTSKNHTWMSETSQFQMVACFNWMMIPNLLPCKKNEMFTFFTLAIHSKKLLGFFGASRETLPKALREPSFRPPRRAPRRCRTWGVLVKIPSSAVSWEPKGTPQCHLKPQEIAGLIKGLLTIGFP